MVAARVNFLDGMGTPAERGEWLSELYEANARAVFGRCRRLLANAEDAADACHEVFVRAISSLQAPPRSPQARSWLLIVAQNHCLDLLRRRRRMEAALVNLAVDAERDGASEAEVHNRQLLDAVLRQLGARERLALWQSAIESRSLGEIAAQLGLSYAAAGQLVHRARKHATLIAARLAGALGLASLRCWRRRVASATLAQMLAALAIVPLVGAGGAGTVRANHQPAALRSPATAGRPTAAGSTATIQTAATLEGRTDGLLPQPVNDTVDQTLGRTTATVTQILDRTIASVPAAPPNLASAVPPLPVPTGLPTLPDGH